MCAQPPRVRTGKPVHAASPYNSCSRVIECTHTARIRFSTNKALLAIVSVGGSRRGWGVLSRMQFPVLQLNIHPLKDPFPTSWQLFKVVLFLHLYALPIRFRQVRYGLPFAITKGLNTNLRHSAFRWNIAITPMSV